MLRILRSALLCPILFLTSCAAMFSGTTAEVAIKSNPTGATFTAGEITGKTPFIGEISKSVTEVTFEIEGQGKRVVTVDRDFGVGWLVMDILLTPGYGLVGCIIDGSTSAWYDLPPIIECDFTKPAKAKASDGESESNPLPTT